MTALYLRYSVSPDLSPHLLKALPRRAVQRQAMLVGLQAPRLPSSPILATQVEISLRLMTAEEIAQLNGYFRQRPQPTNCLSFPAPAQGLVLRHPTQRQVLGDIAIAPPVLLAEAAAQGKAVADHCRHLLLHSTLHLLGYDHQDATQAAVMEALETRLLADLGVADPYLETIHE